MREQTRETTATILTFLSLAIAGAGCDHGGAAGGDGGVRERTGWIRGQVTDVDGVLLADVDVAVNGVSTRSDSRGRFALQALADRELQMTAQSDMYSTAVLPVTVDQGTGAQVQVALKPRRIVKLADAAAGGRVESDDGFALELPGGALLDDQAAAVSGEVEVRYVIIDRPREIAAAPGRMQAMDHSGIEGYGMAEVGFYQNGTRLKLGKLMQMEVPLYEGNTLTEGQEVDVYQMTAEEVRWAQGPRARVQTSKLVVSTAQDEWLSAAAALPATSCMKGKLTVEGGAQAANTTLRAIRTRGLSLIQAETASDGSFCLPVTPDDDWSVSSFFSDGQRSFGLQVDLRSDNAAGMCGGSTGCKDLGQVALPALP